jgi:hypothetical protein
MDMCLDCLRARNHRDLSYTHTEERAVTQASSLRLSDDRT